MFFSDLVSKQKDGKCGYNRETKDILYQNQKMASRVVNDGIRNKKSVSRKPFHENSPFHESNFENKPFQSDDNFSTSTPPRNPTPKYSVPPPSIQSPNMHLGNGPCSPIPVDLGVPPPFNTVKPEQFERYVERDWGKGKPQDVPQHVHVKCLELVRENPLGVQLSDFQILFEGKNNGVPLNYCRYGYRSLKECLSAMTMSLNVRELNRGNFIVFPSFPFCEEWEAQNKAKQKAIARRTRKLNNRDLENTGIRPRQSDANVINYGVDNSRIFPKMNKECNESLIPSVKSKVIYYFIAICKFYYEYYFTKYLI